MEAAPHPRPGQAGAGKVVSFPPVMRTMARTCLGWSAVLLGLLALSGCNSEGYPENLEYRQRSDPLVTEPPQIQPTSFDNPGQFPHFLEDPNYPLLKVPGLVRFPRDIDADKLDEIQEGLKALFGTPREPRLDRATRRALKLSQAQLEEGSTLYRLHCVHCHGLPGDGRGPTAPWINPHPRDFRQGIFKFTSSRQDLGVRKPRRRDLLRTVREGIEGTAMPSFKELQTADEDIDKIISYVIHLSLRGQTEFKIMKDLLTPGSEVGKISTALRRNLAAFARQWVDAENNPIVPPEEYPYPYPVQPADDHDGVLGDSVRNGQEIFKDSKRGGCMSCHFDYGRQGPYYYDNWGTIVRPMDLTKGVYRGGRRPIDLYYRIHSGINGSNMASLLDVEGETPKDREKRIWDLINFLQVLPYPEMRKKYDIKLD